MSQFERDLRESLRRREAPAGFADRVLAQTRTRETSRPSREWQWLAAAALVVLMLGGALFVREQIRQSQNEKTKEQLMVALRITGSKLRLAQSKISTIQLPKIEVSSQE
jgi:hypothetical protein